MSSKSTYICWALLGEHRALLIECRALLRECRARMWCKSAPKSFDESSIEYRVAKTHWMPYRHGSFSAKEPYNYWLFCEK